MANIKKEGVFIALGVAAILIGGYILRDKIKQAAKDFIHFVFSEEQEYFLKELNPAYQKRFRQFIADIEKIGYKVLITSGYRSFEEQAELKRQNSKNASSGRSMHNYGTAIDINLISKKDGSQLMKASSSYDWEQTGVVSLAKKYGFKWGGAEAFGGYHDPVHFEVPLGGDKLYSMAIKQFGSEDRVIGNRVRIAA